MKRKKQQSQRQRQRSWFQKNSISGLRFLARNSQNKCPQGRFRTIQSI